MYYKDGIHVEIAKIAAEKDDLDNLNCFFFQTAVESVFKTKECLKLGKHIVFQFELYWVSSLVKLLIVFDNLGRSQKRFR